MKILVVIPHLIAGGAERVASRLSLEWSRQHEVMVAVFDARHRHYPHGGTLADLALPPVPGALGKARQMLQRAAALARLVRRLGPDRVVSFTESANYPALLACLRCGIFDRLTVSVRASLMQFSRRQQQLMRLAYGQVNDIVAPSEGVSEDLRRLLGPRAAIRTINNPLDLAAIEALAAEAPEIAPPSRAYIVGVGRLSMEKGFDLLIEAYARAGAVDLDLLILGEGPQRDRLEAQRHTLGLDDRVHLPGQVRNPYPLLRAARAFLLPSRAEGYPNALIEAMACGCEVVAFDCPHGPAEILAGGRRGALVEAASVDALAQAITNLHTGFNPVRTRAARDYVQSLAAETIGPRWLSR